MYTRALVAIDRDEESAHQVLKAAENKASELVVLHVLEPQEIQYSMDPTFLGKLTQHLEQQALDAATKRIQELCNTSGVKVKRSNVIIGHTASQIRKSAKDLSCDLIIVGSHGRSGWQRLLGSTANAVLSGAPVDVLAHRIKKT